MECKNSLYEIKLTTFGSQFTYGLISNYIIYILYSYFLIEENIEY